MQIDNRHPRSTRTTQTLACLLIFYSNLNPIHNLSSSLFNDPSSPDMHRFLSKKFEAILFRNRPIGDRVIIVGHQTRAQRVGHAVLEREGAHQPIARIQDPVPVHVDVQVERRRASRRDIMVCLQRPADDDDRSRSGDYSSNGATRGRTDSRRDGRGP